MDAEQKQAGQPHGSVKRLRLKLQLVGRQKPEGLQFRRPGRAADTMRALQIRKGPSRKGLQEQTCTANQSAAQSDISRPDRRAWGRASASSGKYQTKYWVKGDGRRRRRRMAGEKILRFGRQAADQRSWRGRKERAASPTWDVYTLFKATNAMAYG